MDAYGHLCIFCDCEHRRAHHVDIVVDIMYFRMRDHHGAVEFFRRADDCLQAVKTRRIEHADCVLFLLGDFKNFF